MLGSGVFSTSAGRRPAALLAILVAATLFLTACGGGENPGAAAQANAEGPGNRGSRAGEQPVPVAVATAFRGPIATYFHSTASLEAEKEAEVLARATGLVGSLMCEEGDEVPAGQVLLTVVNAEYGFRLQQAQAATANLESKYERLEAMLNEQLVTQEEIEAARSELESARADQGMAEMNLSYTEVRAPFAGRITQRMVDVGQNVSVGMPLVTLADFHPLLARVHVPSREFHRLQQNQAVQLTLDSDGEEISGRIKLISPVIDPTSGTIKLTIEIPEYPADTRPGDFAEVRVVTERRPQALLVPREAVVTDQGEQVVYLVTDGQGERGGQVAERRVVELGFTDDSHAEILSGLAEGEEVVVRGQRSLKHGMPVRVLDDKPTAAGS